MARHYATRDFFRQMPNPLLARYFHARGVPWAISTLPRCRSPSLTRCGWPG